jgi:WhiB family redox-sensing transcriptional regulator
MAKTTVAADGQRHRRTDAGASDAQSRWEESRWQRWAACRDTPTELFFAAGPPTSARREEKQAKRVCSACPVRERCLTFAVGHHELYGVWGGLNPEERRALPGASSAHGSS